MARLAHARDGALRGPVGVVAELRRVRPLVHVGGWLYPGGAEIAAPTPADPHWRGPDDRALGIGELIAGQSDATRELVLAVHAEAIAEIVRVAARAKGTGIPGTVAPQVAAASRLLHGLTGQGAQR